MKKVLYQELWGEKYRPKLVKDVIVDSHIRDTFADYVKNEDFPNLILHSKASGTGKTTLAKALAAELGLEVLFINGSINGTIDIVRNDFTNFVRTYSMTFAKKVIIIDEGDKLSTAMQEGLRTFFEENSRHVRFIITCNRVEGISNALQSRCVVHQIVNKESETKKTAILRTLEILTQEGRTFDRSEVMKFVISNYPDMRRVLNNLQKDSTNLNRSDDLFDIRTVYTLVRSGDFDGYQKWVSTNILTKMDAEHFYECFKKYFLNVCKEPVKKAVMLVKTHDSLHKLYFISNPQINVVAFMASLQLEGVLK